MILCKDCKFWDSFDSEDDIRSKRRDGKWGTCDKADRELLTSKDSKCYAQDSEDYCAWLETRHDFGCVQGEMNESN